MFDLSAKSGRTLLPSAPSDSEKYIYSRRNIHVLVLFSLFSFTCITISTINLYSGKYWLFPLFFLLAYTITYYVASLIINLLSRDFDVFSHKIMVRAWQPESYPSVDVFLPTCGESIDVLRNTWDGIYEMRQAYKGYVFVHCLDDSHSDEVAELAISYGFHYHARPNRGWFKKAGNLRYGFNRTHADFIAIFDADFRPRSDFLDELLPYFHADERLAIVQSPQYFGVDDRQNWLERGAGAVQELFYRAIQVSRQAHLGAICVGSNAIYRRAALNEIGGTALIEHSEDVHTGFELRKKDWHLLYVPLVLAKGLCPAELRAFFRQQYRWCMGSMSLLGSGAFWRTKLPIRSRMCFASGFMYYIHTAVYAVFTPVVPLIMLIKLTDEIQLMNYMLIFPSFLYVHVVSPLWHRAPQGIEAAAVRTVYGWAHLFAIWDKLLDSAQEWQPTGAKHSKDNNYRMFRVGVVVFNFIPAMFWVGLAAYFMYARSVTDFLPIFLLGVYYFFTAMKVVLYRDPSAETAARAKPRLGVLYLTEAHRLTAPMSAQAA